MVSTCLNVNVSVAYRDVGEASCARTLPLCLHALASEESLHDSVLSPSEIESLSIVPAP